MKKLLPLLAIVLLGAGCYPATGPETNAPDKPAAHPPAVVMTAQGHAVAGVEGSYCFGPTCVDKVAPPELVKDSGLAFAEISKGTVAFTSNGKLSAVSVNVQGVTSAAINPAAADLTQDASGAFAYKIPATLPAGDYYLIVSAQFEGGSDVSYIFPVRLK